MKTRRGPRGCSSTLKEHQAPLVQDVAAAGRAAGAAGADVPDRAARRRSSSRSCERFGYDDRVVAARPDRAPVRGGGGIEDIRITTRYFEDRLDGLFATMHESGHGLYEHQVDPRSNGRRSRAACRSACTSRRAGCGRTSSAAAAVLALLLPAAAGALPERSRAATLERGTARSTPSQPSLIRVDADEATYNLHVILRFELEQDMLAESFPLEQLPEEWNRRMWDYLGVEVPDDSHGVLQDMHWAGGALGYFPTYALGNLISAQLWERVDGRHPRPRRRSSSSGEFGALREWLREHLHRHGRKFTPARDARARRRHAGIDPEPYVRYLRAKLGDIYGLRGRLAACVSVPAELHLERRHRDVG